MRLFCTTSERALGPTQPSIQLIVRASVLRRVKLQESVPRYKLHLHAPMCLHIMLLRYKCTVQHPEFMFSAYGKRSSPTPMQNSMRVCFSLWAQETQLSLIHEVWGFHVSDDRNCGLYDMPSSVGGYQWGRICCLYLQGREYAVS
jgi:hypothetical protein